LAKQYSKEPAIAFYLLSFAFSSSSLLYNCGGNARFIIYIYIYYFYRFNFCISCPWFILYCEYFIDYWWIDDIYWLTILSTLWRTWKLCPTYLRKFKISSIFFSDFQGNLFISSYQAASKSLACICVSHKNARSLMTTLTHTQTNKNISVSIWYSLMIMFSQVTMQIDILTVLSDILLAMVLDVYSMPIPLFSTSVIDLTLNSPLLFHFTYYAVLIIAGCPLAFTLSLVRFWDLEQPSLNPKLVGVSYMDPFVPFCMIVYQILHNV